MYRFTIFDTDIEIVQSLIADVVSFDGPVAAFATDGDITMVYNLPPGFSITKEDA